MKIYFFVIIVLMAACNHQKANNWQCTYTLDELFKHYDSAKFQVTKSHTKDWLDVSEIIDTGGEKNLYQFDRNRKLRFYAFITDTTNLYDFSISYDSIGQVVNTTGAKVVRWYLYKPTKDSIELSFLLNTMHSAYKKICITVANDSFNNLTLFKSRYSNLVGSNIILSSKVLLSKDSSKKVAYITGLKINFCTRDSTIFKDSVYLPDAFKK